LIIAGVLGATGAAPGVIAPSGFRFATALAGGAALGGGAAALALGAPALARELQDRGLPARAGEALAVGAAGSAGLALVGAAGPHQGMVRAGKSGVWANPHIVETVRAGAGGAGRLMVGGASLAAGVAGTRAMAGVLDEQTAAGPAGALAVAGLGSGLGGLAIYRALPAFSPARAAGQVPEAGLSLRALTGTAGRPAAAGLAAAGLTGMVMAATDRF